MQSVTHQEVFNFIDIPQLIETFERYFICFQLLETVVTLLYILSTMSFVNISFFSFGALRQSPYVAQVDLVLTVILLSQPLEHCTWLNTHFDFRSAIARSFGKYMFNL